MSPQTPKVLIVCLGNICRSPMGEAVLEKTASERGIAITVDSAGTSGQYDGERPHHYTEHICEKHDVPIKSTSISRKVKLEDFQEFDYILAADKNNLRDLKRLQPAQSTAQVKLWGSYTDGKPIEDPWWSGQPRDFEACYKHCVELSNAFLDTLEERESKEKL